MNTIVYYMIYNYIILQIICQQGTLIIGGDIMNDYRIGNRIRNLRTQLQISQEHLALKAGITPVYLGQIEREEKNPTIKIIEKIADAFGLTLAEFFCDTDTVPSSVIDTDMQNQSHFEKMLAFEIQGFSETEKEELLLVLRHIIKLRNMAKDRPE